MINEAPLRVLILEDSEDHAELIQRVVRNGRIAAEYRVVDAERQFREALSEFSPQLILADLMVPSFSGTAAVAIAREWNPTVPCILVSGVAGEELAVSSLRSGASDYVLKSRLELLPGAIRRALDEAAEKRLLQSLDADRKRAEVALRESEAKYRRIVDTASEGILVLAADGVTMTFVNAALATMLGRRVDEFAGRPVTDLMFPEDLTDHGSRIGRRRTGVSEQYERRFRHTDGEPRWTAVSAAPIWDDDHVYSGSFAMLTDITERRRNEEAIRRLNRELTAISRCNQELLRAEDEQSLVNEVCRIVCEDAGYRLAWVGYAEHDEAMSVRPVAVAGLDDGYVAEANITWRDEPRGRGPSGIAIRTGRTVAIGDHESDPGVAPWLEAMRTHGLRSGIVLPLRDAQGTAFGALHAYSGETHAYAPSEVSLLEQLANDLAFGIGALRSRVELKQAEAARSEHVNFLEGLDRVNRAIQGAGDLDQMMSDAMDAVLEIFESDRAYLLHPCDPDASTWRVPKESTRPEYPGVRELNLEIPADPDVAETFRVVLDAEGPVAFGPGSSHPLAGPVPERFGFKSFLAMALRPKTGKPWQLGLHQCSYVREWSASDRRLLAEIGHRLEDALTALLSRHELIESEKRYRELFEHSPASLWEEDFTEVKNQFDHLRAQGVVDLDAYLKENPDALVDLVGLVRILDVNKAALHLHGAATREELESGLSSIFTAESLDTFERELACLWAGGTSMVSDGVVRTLSGEARNVIVEFNVCPGYERTLGRVIVSTLDVTERRRAGEEIRTLNHELERQVQQYRLLLDQASDAIFVSDSDRRYTDVNVAACALLGYTREELLNLSVADVVPPDVNPGQSQRFTRMKASETVLTERLLRRRDGELVITELSSRQLPDGRYQAIVRDITERKRLEEEQARLATAVEQADEAILITDSSANIIYVNPAFERVSGYSRNELIGQNPRMLHSGRHDATFYKSMWATLSAGRTWHGTFSNRRKNGEIFEEDAAISPIRDETGAVVSYVGVKRDITRERALEEQLRQSQKMEAIGQLAGGIAHDFNNLITAIRGYSEMVRDGLPADAAEREDVDQVVLAADRAAELTRQLLAFSRRAVLQTQVVAPAEIVERLAPMLRRLLGEHIELVSHATPELAFVRVDPSQLEQIIINLAVNARDAMPTGGRLTIETGVSDGETPADARPPGGDGEGHVVLTVTDTGTGMDESTQARVFEPFFTTKGPGQGTGMGLATVYGIVKQSLGEIQLHSEPGHGTTFTIWLPRVKDDRAPAADSEGGATPRGFGTILLVEDEPSVRKLGARALRELGYDVIEASDGVEGAARAAKYAGSIDLLVTDVIMPRMGGNELWSRLREARPELPVLFTSGFAREAEGLVGADTHDRSLLIKPFTREALARAVRDALKPRA